MKRLILVLLAALGIAVGAAAAMPEKAEALTFPGLYVIDTEYNCPKVANGYPQCYTWIRIDGQVRRGSPAEYFSEASGGYVYTACAHAAWHANSDYDVWNKDWYGVVVSPHFHWALITNNDYCKNPKTPAGYVWQGYSYSVVNNVAPY